MDLIEKLETIDSLQAFLLENPLPNFTEQSINNDFKLKYTYDSNAIEGNTLTLQETKVVLEEGLVIGGKTLKEHFEVVNHAMAINYIESLAAKQEPLSENQIKAIHHLILRNIDDKNAGQYRQCNVKISGSKHIPPHYCNIQTEMENFTDWYFKEAQDLHPIIRASRVHIEIVGIHPFTDGNGRTSRLLMNLELMKSKFPAINIKSDMFSLKQIKYYEALDKAHCDNDFTSFYNLVADYTLQHLEERKNLLYLGDENEIVRKNQRT